MVGGRVVDGGMGEARGGRGIGLIASVRAWLDGVEVPRRPLNPSPCGFKGRLLIGSAMIVFAVVTEASDVGEGGVAVGVKRVRPFNVPRLRSFPLPFFCSGCGVLGVAVCVDVLDSDEVDGAGDTEREELAVEDPADLDACRDACACTRLRVSRMRWCVSWRAATIF